MGRGKDGFDSLLVKSEGGEAEEIVSEENGILISMLLRQYFLSLKILGKWKMWGRGMTRHWKGVQDSLHESHPVVEPQIPSEGTRSSLPVSTEELGIPHHESDDESSAEESNYHTELADQKEREIHLIKKVTRKWRRLAGLSGQADCCDNMAEPEFKIDWTKVCSFSIDPNRENSLFLTFSRPSHLD